MSGGRGRADAARVGGLATARAPARGRAGVLATGWGGGTIARTRGSGVSRTMDDFTVERPRVLTFAGTHRSSSCLGRALVAVAVAFLVLTG